ncbi:MAG: SDR family oxidoreductase [Armatimonadota bacterium]|nr:SDR family oxidoreductase [Armatimonadota bacterium]
MSDALLARLFSLQGQAALVTGGSRGIGLAIARALGEAGARVALVARRAAWLQPAERELREAGIACAAFEADVAQAEQVTRAVEAAEEAVGALTILVNAAGRTWGAPAEAMPPERWREVVEANATGTFLTCQAVGRRMIERRYGRILNIASVAGLTGSPPEILNAAGYAASKGAIIALTRDLAVKWARFGITVNALAPGFVPTRMSETVIARAGQMLLDRIPVGRIGTTDDLLGAVLCLVAPSAGYITGQVLAVDGGMTAA